MLSSSENPFGNPDVIVIGAGNAAACAALAAREQGASVIMIEAAPRRKQAEIAVTQQALCGLYLMDLKI